MAEDKYISSYTGNEIDRAISVSIFEQVETAGAGITFEKSKIYNSPDDPTYGEIVQSLDGAVTGTVQKIYHQDSSKPTFPDNWVNIGGGDYVDDEVNIIYAYYISDDRIEYQINDFLLESNIDHNSLKNYEENEHIDHTDININGGEGLGGGGTIDRNRTLYLQLVVKDGGDAIGTGYALDFNENINVVNNDDRTFTVNVSDPPNKASEIENDSTAVTGVYVSDALDNLGGEFDNYYTKTEVDDELDNLESTTIDFNSEYDDGTANVDITIDWSNGNNQVVTLGGDIEISFSNMGVGHKQLRVVQDADGDRTPTIPSGKWPDGGEVGSFTTDPEAEDILSIFYNGTDYYYMINNDWK